MTQSIANLAVDITANLAGFQSDLGRMNREADKAAKQLQRDFSKIGAQIGAGLAIGFAAIAVGVRSAINDIDKLNDASKKLGVSTEFLSAMGYAAKQSGADVAGFERGFTKFLRTVSEASSGQGAAADLFKAIGVSVRDNNGVLRASEEIFGDVADRFKEFKGGAGEVEIAQRLMGRAGAELIPLLNEGSDGFQALTAEAKAFGQIVSSESAAAAGQFNDDLDRLKAQMGGLALVAAQDLLPTLSNISGLMVDAGGKAVAAGNDVGVMEYSLQRMAIAGVIVKNTLEGLLNIIFATGTAAAAASGLVKQGVEGFIDVVASAADGPSAQLAELERVATAQAAAMNDAWSSVKQGFTAAGNGISDAVNDINAGIASIEAPAKRGADALKGVATEGKKTPPTLAATGTAAADAAGKVKKLVNAGDEMVATWRKQNKEALESYKWLKAQLDPLEALNQEYEEQKQVIEDARRANVGNAEALAEIDEQLKRVESRYRDQRRAIEAQANPVQTLLENLQFEIDLLKMSNIEREAAIALRGLEGDATAEQAAQLRELLQSRALEEQTQQQVADWQGMWEDAITSIGESMLAAFKQGGGNLGDALGDSVKNSLDRAFSDAMSNFASQLSGLMSGQQGVTGGSVMQAGGDAAIAAVGAIGASYVGGESSRGASVAGGAVAGAAYGAQTFGLIGAVVGLILGAIVGWVAYQDPVLEVSSSASGINHGRVEGRATSALGEIFVGKDDLTLAGNMTSQALAEKIAEFDNVIASFLTAQDLELARAAMARFDVNQRGHGLDPAKVLAQRFETVVRAVEPEWLRFLNGITSLEDRIQAFQGLRAMEEQIGLLDAQIAALGADPFDTIRFALHNLQEAVDSSRETFDAALSLGDPVAIAEAAAPLQQAILRRYQAEIEMVRALQTEIEEASNAARDFGIAMAQRLRGVGADVSVAGVVGSGLGELQASVGTASNIQTSIANLNRFTSAVDQWLSAARAEVEQAAAAARARLQALLGALDVEQGSLMQVASERQAAEQAAAQASAAAAQAANQAQIDALNRQLQIAQQWVGVLNSAQSLLDQMAFGTANPLGGFARQDLLENRIAGVRSRLATAGAGDRSGLASELITLLNQRLGAAGELFQRPSPEYLDVFNQTAAEVSGLRDIAQEEQARAAALQEQIAALQGQTVQAVIGVSDTLAYLSSDERTRLDEIEAERIALQNELLEVDRLAQEQLDAINKQARAYYEWAQTTGNELNERRQRELVAALNEITGGVDADSFIAARLAETTRLLEEIRDAIADFLADISAPITQPGNPYGPGGPRFPGRPPGFGDAPAGITVTNVININGNADPRAVADAVDARMTSTLQSYASRLKQELKVA